MAEVNTSLVPPLTRREIDLKDASEGMILASIVEGQMGVLVRPIQYNGATSAWVAYRIVFSAADGPAPFYPRLVGFVETAKFHRVYLVGHMDVTNGKVTWYPHEKA